MQERKRFWLSIVSIQSRQGSNLTQIVWRFAWTALALALLGLAPSQLYLSQAAWRLPDEMLTQVVVLSAAFLGFSFTVVLAEGIRRRRLGLAMVLAGGVVFYGAAYLFLVARPTIPNSRALFLMSAVGGGLLALTPAMIRKRLPLATGALVVAVVGLVAAGAGPGAENQSHETRLLSAALEPIRATYHSGLVGPMIMDGGAIDRYGRGMLLVTGDGDFYMLEWADDSTLTSEKLPIPPPMDRDHYLRDQPDPATAPRLRVTDLLVDTSAASPRLLVSHQHWSSTGRCFTMQVSSIPLEAGSSEPAEGTGGWSRVAQTQPCLEFMPGFDDIETGGRLAWDNDGTLLMTVGDHGFNGLALPALSQQTDNHYGKIVRVGDDGQLAIVTLGHRNPQGLWVDRDGPIWSTEHGPQGGDEINVVEPGANYGWPIVTYGTQYGEQFWPLAPNSRNHGEFREPAHVFVPSPGISNLLRMSGAELPRWDGDLLVSSLRLRRLYRVRTRGERVVYVEPIMVDRRIRDLALARDGRLVLWTDEGDVVVISRAKEAATGEVTFQWCQSCHEADSKMGVAAPTLRGIVGREIASVPGYRYSESLARLDGPWTEERLNDFLRDPGRFAPGTSMTVGGIADEATRRAVIDFLRQQE